MILVDESRNSNKEAFSSSMGDFWQRTMSGTCAIAGPIVNSGTRLGDAVSLVEADASVSVDRWSVIGAGSGADILVAVSIEADAVSVSVDCWSLIGTGSCVDVVDDDSNVSDAVVVSVDFACFLS